MGQFPVINNSRPNANARKAALHRIREEMIEGPSPRHKYVIMLVLKFIILSFTSINNEYLKQSQIGYCT